MSRSRIRTLGYIELATGIGILTFWALFYTVGLAPEAPPKCYFAFEDSFLLPDSVLALGLIVGGTCLIKGQKLGQGISLTCAGGLLFLGLVDFSFNLQNGIYTGPIVEAALSAAINLWCIALGLRIVFALNTGSTLDPEAA